MPERAITRSRGARSIQAPSEGGRLEMTTPSALAKAAQAWGTSSLSYGPETSAFSCRRCMASGCKGKSIQMSGLAKVFTSFFEWFYLKLEFFQEDR
jgi:hypothetical protein